MNLLLLLVVFNNELIFKGFYLSMPLWEGRNICFKIFHCILLNTFSSLFSQISIVMVIIFNLFCNWNITFIYNSFFLGKNETFFSLCCYVTYNDISDPNYGQTNAHISICNFSKGYNHEILCTLNSHNVTGKVVVFNKLLIMILLSLLGKSYMNINMRWGGIFWHARFFNYIIYFWSFYSIIYISLFLSMLISLKMFYWKNITSFLFRN